MFINNLDNFSIPEHVIIGSGPAGLSLAFELEKKGINSLIIEAGDKYVTEESQNFFNGNFYGENYFELDEARLRCLGGSSGHWGGNCRPLNNFDFESWPVQSKDLYKFDSIIHELLDLNYENKFIKKKSVFNNFDTINFKQSNVSFGEKYEEKITKSKKISLLLNSPLLSINVSSRKKNIINEITIFLNNKVEKKILVKKIILACGGIENSRILLWSKIKNNIENLSNSPIGEYWSDHPGGPVGQLITKERIFKNYFEEKIFEPKNSYLKENNLNNMRIRFIKTYESTNKIDQSLKDLLCFYPNVGKKFFETIQNKRMLYCNYVISFSAEQKPIKENKVYLSKNKDSLGIPKVNIKWEIRNDVYDSLEFVLKDFGKELINIDYGRIGIDQNIFDKNLKNSGKIYANYHHIGGTIMGNDIKKSVVDKNLKVHKFQNLYIAGSSVFPSIGHANPTYTILALSIRLANHLSKL